MAGPAGYTQPGGGGGAAGYSAPSPTFAKATPGVSQRPGGNSNLGSMLSSLMGLGAKGKLEDIYTENRDYNKMIQDEAYQRSLPKGVTGPAGKVSFDAETEEMLMELDPEIQGVMDGWLRAEQRAGQELGAYNMDERTINQISMFDKANEFRDNQARLQMEESNFQRGIAGTGAFYNNMALGEQVNQRRLQEALKSREMAMGERNLLSAEQLAFGNAAIEAPRTLMAQAELSRLIGQGSHTGVNVEGVALGSLALADTKAGYYSGMLGTSADYSEGGGSGGSGSGMFGGALDFASSIFT
jgi:hypothetical protein|tara:strand:+ start:209 stop:1105 length:897 start_codon:yes stop_codon:yes gene_type:complete